jgi:hypothetical protein
VEVLVDEDAAERMRARLEAIREEAYRRGYTDAVRDMEIALGISAPITSKATKGRLVEGESPKITVPRGLTRQLVSDAFRREADRAMSPIEVQHSILTKAGKNLAATSVRRAIDALEREGRISRVGEAATWQWAEKE